MASHKFFSLIVLTALLLIFTTALSPKELQCSSQKVHLTIYYDTLTPSCEEFIVFELPKAFELDFMPIINLRLIPYGNAYIHEPNDTIICQVSFPTFLIFFSFHGFLTWCFICIYSAEWTSWMLLEQYRSLCNQHLARCGEHLYK